MAFPDLGRWRASFRSWWAFSTEMQRDHIKIGVGVAALLICAGGLYYWSRPSIQRWQSTQALDQAKEFAARKDYRSALLALQRAMSKNAYDVAGWKQVADFLSELGSPEVLVARRNLVVLAPDDLSLRLGFVLDALRFGDVDAAKDMFGAVRAGAQEEVAFFRMAAAIAYVTGHTEQLENHLQEIVRRSPEDAASALNLATFRLWGADAARADAAEQTLLTLVSKPEVRVRAAVELLKHVAQTGDRVKARELVARFHTEFLKLPPPAATSAGVDALAEPPGWVAVVEAIKREGFSSEKDAPVVMRWLATIGQAREALVWLDGAPAKVQRSPIVSAAALELATRINDVERLRPLLLEGAWGNARPQSVDLAFASRWQRQMGRLANAQATWADAIAAAGDSLPNLRVLTRLAMAWDDNEAARVGMHAVVDRFANERWAWEALKLDYLRRQETAKLWQLYDKWSRAQPENLIVAQDWVMLSYLAGQASPTVHARAKELFQRSPEATDSTLGYAVSLRAQKKPADALALLNKLPESEQQGNRVKLWRGVLLAETNQKPAARSLLATVEAANFLPEETQIWREATALANPPPPAPPKPVKAATPAKS